MKHIKILICGLPGSGKTTLARALQKELGAVWFDGDDVRAWSNNFDFSLKGREQQAFLMGQICDAVVRGGKYAIASFICPTESTHRRFANGTPPYTVFVDRIIAGCYQDTNAMWQPPALPNFTVHPVVGSPEASAVVVARQIAKHITTSWQARPEWNSLSPTALMVGRFQPWHKGHRALFEVALKKYGQVAIAIRCLAVSPENPYTTEQIEDAIRADLRPQYEQRFLILRVPNIASVVYGRNVGYTIERIFLDEDIEQISATDIRKAQGDETSSFDTAAGLVDHVQSGTELRRPSLPGKSQRF
jgi:adenylylsulfate kinase-like enzyme